MENRRKAMSGMGRRIQWAVILLSMCLLMSCGNAEGKTEAEKAAVAQCTELMEQVSVGHWEAAAGNLNLLGLAGGLPSTEGGILQAILGRMSYKITSAAEQKDGSVTIGMQITAVDLKKLLESLPDDISSETEAKQAMMSRVSQAPTKSYHVQVSIRYKEGAGYQMEVSTDFANALTGGIYDIMADALGGLLG